MNTSPEIRTSTHIRTSQRRKGQRLSKQERETAQETFLQSFATTANVRAACAAAGIDRATVYTWMEHDEFFALRYKQAELDANDTIRAAIFQRGVLGYEKPVVSMGKVVYGQDGMPLMERVYSDTLLSLLAKARMPEYRDKQQIEHSGSIDIASARELLLQKLQKLREQEPQS